MQRSEDALEKTLVSEALRVRELSPVCPECSSGLQASTQVLQLNVPQRCASLPLVGAKGSPWIRSDHRRGRFGCAQRFLEENALQLILRSHEGPDARYLITDPAKNMRRGFSLDHDTSAGQLYTVFSAPDYPQFQVCACCVSAPECCLVLARVALQPSYGRVPCRRGRNAPEPGSELPSVACLPQAGASIAISASPAS